MLLSEVFLIAALLISSEKAADRFLVFLDLHIVLYSQLVEYFRQKVVRLVMNYRTLQHWKKEFKHANLHGSHVCYKPFSTPVSLRF